MQRGFEPSMFAVLVVDDEEANRDVLHRLLEREGYFVVDADGGAEALERLRGSSFDLVMLDIMMPNVTGIDVLRTVRSTHAREQLPVIMASANHDGSMISACLQLGANDYVTKPLDFGVVLARVQTQLQLRAAIEGMKASEARFRMIAELSTDMISMHAPDGVFRFASPSCRDLLGYGADELELIRLFDLVHPTDRTALPATPAEMPPSCTIIVRLRRKDDSWVWCELRSRTVHGSRSGRVTDIQCVIRDVSLYVNAWRPQASGRPLPPVAALLGEDAPRIVVHQDHLVNASVEPPPVRRRRPGS